MNIDFNTLIQAILVAGALAAGRTLWKTATLVERLDERTAGHEHRIAQLEDKAA